jgi:ankyrin repeat protein
MKVVIKFVDMLLFLFYFLPFICFSNLEAGMQTEKRLDGNMNKTAENIMSAVCSGNIGSVEKLVCDIEDINEVNVSGWTPLHNAVIKCSPEIVRLLVKKGADINSSKMGRSTPFHIACSLGFEEIFDILVSEGADINHSDSNNCTPLWYAMYNAKRNIVEKLIKMGADANFDMPEQIKGDAPIHAVCRIGDTSLIDIILKNNSKALITSKNCHEKTPLEITVEHNHKEAYRLLVKKGAGAPMPEIFTHIYYGALEEIKELVEKDPSIVVKKMDEKTEMYPIHLASWVGSVKTIKLLLYHGADTSVCDSKGLTAFDYAEKSVNREEVLEVLKQGTGAEKE